MSIERLFPLLLTVLFVVCIVLEALRPARPLPKTPGWKLRGVLAFFVTGAVSGAVPVLYMDFIRDHRLLHLEWLGLGWGAALALVCSDFVNYWVHRWSHTPALWRAYHQVHHSAERMDIFGSAYFHPLEIAIGGLISALVMTLALGVLPEAAALAALVSIGISMFQHLNMRTPRWLGYVVQRPEAHSVHHARGVHAFNYARLPIFDLLFGTFSNPEHFEPEAGFYPGASLRLLPALVGVDISAPPSAASPRQAVVS